MKIHTSKYLYCFLWTLITAVGMALGFALSRIFEEKIYGFYEPELTFLETLVITSLLIGVGQSVILRSKLRKNWIWIPATTIGIALGSFISLLVDEFLPGSIRRSWVDPFIMLSITGMFVGIIQWALLHRHLNGSFKWVLVSALSWGIGMGITFLIFDAHLWKILSDIYSGLVLADLVFGFLVGVIVGIGSGATIESTILYHPHESS